jgi:hypothetical protein
LEVRIKSKNDLEERKRERERERGVVNECCKEREKGRESKNEEREIVKGREKRE